MKNLLKIRTTKSNAWLIGAAMSALTIVSCTTESTDLEDQGGGSETIDGFSLDTSYNMQLRFINDRISVVVDGDEVFGRTMNTAGNGSYFKLGNYLQSVQNANYTGSFGLAGFRNLSVSH